MSRNAVWNPCPLPLAGLQVPPFLRARLSAGLGLDQIGYGLFLLVNAALFLRPADMVPNLAGWPIYETLVVLCALASLGSMLRLLQPAALIVQPITLFVVALLPAVVLSHLSHGRTWEARLSALQFGKLIVYYLLLVANVTTARRLRCCLGMLVGACMVLTVMALLQFHGFLDISALTEVSQKEWDAASGGGYELPRLVGAGIFHDPNDLCMLLIVAMVVCVYGLQKTGERSGRWRVRRIAWLALLGTLTYAILLTHSRGGFLSLLAAGIVLGITQWGWRRTALAAVVALPIFVIFGGRQTDLTLGDGTGQDRLQLWSLGLAFLRQHPLTGMGMNMFPEAVGQAAHNSFVQCFAELGLLGGTLFVAAFYCAIRPLWSQRAPGRRIDDGPELLDLRPLLLTMLVAYAAGAMSLSRAYVVPTYMALGLSAAFLHIGGMTAPRLSLRLTCTVAAASVGLVAVLYVFVRLFVHWSAS